VLLKRSKAEGSGWMVITAGWAFAVMAGVFVALACGGEANLNPAVTLGLAVRTGIYSKFLPFFVVQVLGGIAGAVLVWLQYLPHWRETPDASAKLACFCTSPAIRSLFPNLLSEIIATFVLIFVIGAIYSKFVFAKGPAPGFFAVYVVSSLVWGVGLSLGGSTGYESCAGFGTAHRTCDFADPRQRRLRLELCSGAHHWVTSGWSVGGTVAAASQYLKYYLKL
jgi:glycerol uptake facilitator protein